MVKEYTTTQRTPVLLLALATLVCGCKPVPIATPATPQQIKAQITASPAPLLLVHVWATWCQPCREEFPELVKVLQGYAEDQLGSLLISADDPDDAETVKAFLVEHGSPVGSLISTDLSPDFIQSLSPNWSGALPATFLFDSNATLLAEWEGKKSYHQYIQIIEQLRNQNRGGL